MISYLKGVIHNKRKGSLILLVADVGYTVNVNPTMYSEYAVGDRAEFYIHQHIKEDASDLYGFIGMEELEMFELLIGVSGIGPKSALGVLAIAGIEDIKETIAQGDYSMLVKVSGIGKKTAERIVLELRDKVSRMASLSGSGVGVGQIKSDEIDALMALGYSLMQAREALKSVSPTITDSGERIRAALKNIGN